LIDSTTRHYNSTDTHSASLWLAFLTSAQQGRALEHSFVVLNGVSTHCYAYWKYTRSLRTEDTLDDTNGVRIIEVQLYSSHPCCIYCFCSCITLPLLLLWLWPRNWTHLDGWCDLHWIGGWFD